MMETGTDGRRNNGGARKGAGRKNIGLYCNFRVSAELWEWARAQGMSGSAYIRLLLERDKARKGTAG